MLIVSRNCCKIWLEKVVHFKSDPFSHFVKFEFVSGLGIGGFVSLLLDDKTHSFASRCQRGKRSQEPAVVDRILLDVVDAHSIPDKFRSTRFRPFHRPTVVSLILSLETLV